MALQITITLPSTVVVTNAYAVITGYNMFGKDTIVAQVSFFASAAAQVANAPAADKRQYSFPNPVPMSLITPLISNGTIDILEVMYVALRADEPDFVGATLVA